MNQEINKQHKPGCLANMSCAVYHADGICPGPYGRCNCDSIKDTSLIHTPLSQDIKQAHQDLKVIGSGEDIEFYPGKVKECIICGISSFAHRHKKGTNPNDFEKIEELKNPFKNKKEARRFFGLSVDAKCNCTQDRLDRQKCFPEKVTKCEHSSDEHAYFRKDCPPWICAKCGEDFSFKRLEYAKECEHEETMADNEFCTKCHNFQIVAEQPIKEDWAKDCEQCKTVDELAPSMSYCAKHDYPKSEVGWEEIFDEKYEELVREIAKICNRHSLENRSNTRDFLLAEFMLGCLTVYENTVRREKELSN